MLAKANRVVRAQDFRLTVRRGRRSTSPTSVVYRLERGPEHPMRFGFIASRAIGNAVQRNRWRRRLRAIGREMVDAGAAGADVVVRGLPGCADRDFHQLREELHEAVRRTAAVRT